MERAQLRRQRMGQGDLPNRCLSSATACLYGVTEAAVLAAGYAPAVGFHSHRKAAVLRIRRGGRLQVRNGGAGGVQALPQKTRIARSGGALACRDVFRETQVA